LAPVKTIRAALAGTALVAVLAGCGTPVAGTPAAQPAPPPDPAADRQAVEDVFHQYYDALQARDFPRACSYNAPETTEQLLASLRTRGVDAASCEEAFTAVYAVPGAEQIVQEAADTAVVQDIAVAGDSASITWSSEVGGGRRTATTQLRRGADRWLLLDVGA
jgi:ketosteroid isomerase-like protein